MVTVAPLFVVMVASDVRTLKRSKGGAVGAVDVGEVNALDDHWGGGGRWERRR